MVFNRNQTLSDARHKQNMALIRAFWVAELHRLSAILLHFCYPSSSAIASIRKSAGKTVNRDNGCQHIPLASQQIRVAERSQELPWSRYRFSGCKALDNG